jgi:hypothetical protein
MKLKVIIHEAEEGAIGLRFPLFPVVLLKEIHLKSF